MSALSVKSTNSVNVPNYNDASLANCPTAYDGNLTTAAVAGNGTHRGYIIWDLGAVYTLSGLQAWVSSGNNAGGAVVYYSTDGLAWGTPLLISPSGSTTYVSSSQSNPYAARYVRFDTGSSTDSLYETKVYVGGTVVAPPSNPQVSPPTGFIMSAVF